MLHYLSLQYNETHPQKPPEKEDPRALDLHLIQFLLSRKDDLVKIKRGGKIPGLWKDRRVLMKNSVPHLQNFNISRDDATLLHKLWKIT